MKVVFLRGFLFFCIIAASGFAGSHICTTMATSVIYSDDQDDLIMDFERESDTDSEDESSDDDSGEVREGDRAPEAAGEAEGTGEGTISILDETFEVETGRTDYDQNDHCIQ